VFGIKTGKNHTPTSQNIFPESPVGDLDKSMMMTEKQSEQTKVEHIGVWQTTANYWSQ